MQTFYFIFTFNSQEHAFEVEAYDMQHVLSIVDGISAGLRADGSNAWADGQRLTISDISKSKRRGITYVKLADWVRS